MYLFILEDGEILYGSSYTQGDLDCSDDGILDIINISNSEQPKQYYKKYWHLIENVNYKGE